RPRPADAGRIDAEHPGADATAPATGVAAIRARPAGGDRSRIRRRARASRRSPPGAQDRQACLAGNAPRILARSMKFRSIAVEGPIGVGKTSFVELLVKKFDSHKVLERVENPFLRDFYLDKTGAAFQAQLFFLLSRYRQLMELSQRTLFSQVTICDYIFPKDKIFAYLNLDDSELLIYDRLYAMLEPQVPKPDLVIFLQADTPRLIERIKRRKRDYESEISEAYVTEVAKA